MVFFKQIMLSFLLGYAAMLLTSFFTDDTDVSFAIGIVASVAMYAKFQGWFK